MTAKQRFDEWKLKVTDSTLVAQLNQMTDLAIENAFYKELEFGTGGLRGEIGVGSNCLNIYTIAKVTQGIADYMKASGMTKVAISCDSRNNSRLFAETAASIFAGNGIQVWLTADIMPTPFVSFITREYGADIGVMITASHNPAKYNGYKVYGSDGCQLTDDGANAIIELIKLIDPFKLTIADFQQLVQSKKIEYVSDDMIEKYLNKVLEQSVSCAKGSHLKVVYTPLNGAGYKLVPRILDLIGLKGLEIVEQQSYPDGNFPTCTFPNPEKAEALKLGLEKAQELSADILLATDPDADRVGTAVRHNGEYVLISGNEMGVLLTDYLFKRRKENGTLPAHPIAVKTIVTSTLSDKIILDYGGEVFNVLTGFKYIGDIIGKLEAKGEADRFVIGFEESYGYLAGSYVRDKDAVVASMLIIEMTNFYQNKNMTLVDRLQQIYKKYGTYEHKLKSYEYPGAEGNAKMKTLLAALRSNLPTIIGGLKVTETIDYMSQTKLDLPKANVLSFNLEGGSQLIVRPSGTEPLIKMYITASKTVQENAQTFDKIYKYLEQTFNAK